MILNLKHVTQNEVLTYNYLIMGVAVFGLILNILVMKKATENKLKALPGKEKK